jgi:hypothetical protein
MKITTTCELTVAAASLLQDRYCRAAYQAGKNAAVVVLHQSHTSFSSYAGQDVVEGLTKCRLQRLSRGDFRNRIARWPLLTLMVGVRWLRLRRLFTSAKIHPNKSLISFCSL